MTSPPETTPRPRCNATTRHGNPCQAYAAQDGKCPIHAGIQDPSAMGKKSRPAAKAANGKRVLDEGVRERLRRESVKSLPEIVKAYHRGLASEDPATALKSAQGLLQEAFGRVGTVAPDELDPSRMIHHMFRRPPRDEGEDERVYAVLTDGRILLVERDDGGFGDAA
jgi:hypothetical protein